MRMTAVLAIALATLPSVGWSQSVSEQFVGTWGLERIEARSDTGDWTRAKTRFGNNPLGSLIYDAEGNMAVQLMRQGRPLLSSDGLAKAQRVTPEALTVVPAEEKAIAFDGYTAYFGKYSVRHTEGVVVHHRTGRLVPNQATLSVERHFEFLNDTLVLTVPGGNRLVWKRAH